MNIREYLEGSLGVWKGFYLHHDAEGALVERVESRQELRLEGDDWFERIVYHPGTDREQVHDFRGVLRGDDLDLGMEGFTGNAVMIDDTRLYFSGVYDSGLRIDELVTIPDPDTKVRIWQRFDDARLVGMSLIQETRAHDLQPEEWR